MCKVNVFKKITNDAKLFGAGAAFVGVTLVSGCNPTNVPTNPDQTTPTTQDPVDNPESTVVDPEVVEPVEEVELPSIVIYDENGDFYKPQDVTLDEMYERIDYANEKYDWKSDWDRDRFVGLLLYENAYYMKDEDVKTLYYDYLDNFGIDILDGEHGEILTARGDGDRTKIDLEDYYIDPVLASEAKKFQYIIDNDMRDEFVESKRDEIESLDYTCKFCLNGVSVSF